MKTKSRWATWSSGTEIKKGFHNIFLEASGAITPAETDVGNPTGTGAVSPSEKARQLGLQSNGHGSYLDPATGEIVARTVNGELVFYDHRGAGGGAVSDGSGGAALTQSAPSWRDPDTGMIIVPPAKPESPQELAVVPDPTPATAPMGYDKFMQQRKVEVAKEKQIQQQAQQEIASKEDILASISPELSTEHQELLLSLDQEQDPIEIELLLSRIQDLENKVETGEPQ